MNELLSFVRMKNEELEAMFNNEEDIYGFENQIRLSLIIDSNIESIIFLGMHIWDSDNYPHDFSVISKNIEKILNLFNK